jgi:hypothetical protein
MILHVGTASPRAKSSLKLPTPKFTDELGDRMQTLLDKKKADSLTSNEALELEAIGELDEIFSYISAVIAATAHGHS